MGILDFRSNDQLLYLVITLNRTWNTRPDAGGFHYWGQLGDSRYHWAWILSPLSIRASHEIIEACTDPEYSGWLQPENGNEVADICENGEDFGIESVDGVSAAVYWSNVDDTCIVPHRVAKVRLLPDPTDKCVGPHVGGSSLFSVQIGYDPNWIDPTGIPLVNPKFAWSFDTNVAAPTTPTNQSILKVVWTKAAQQVEVSVAVTADGGVNLTATITILKVLDAVETEIVRKMCELRTLISTIALLPPPSADPEGPIIATILPTPSEINRFRGLVTRMSHAVDKIAEMHSGSRLRESRQISG
jgi:hypothetical protein